MDRNTEISANHSDCVVSILTVPFIDLSICARRFFMASFYTRYDTTHFIINLATMLLAVVPKFPVFIGVRLFDINRY